MAQLIEMLKRHEGVRSKVYMCSAGYETIGVGRNIADSGLGLSDDEIDYLLNNDIERVRQELTDTYFWFPALNDLVLVGLLRNLLDQLVVLLVYSVAVPD